MPKNHAKNKQSGSWIDEPTKYYIRSSILGNEVVTEVGETGRKAKTIVRAAGATLAWQTVFFNANNNTETEYVNFEHWDASGLSYRSTTNDGTAIYSEGAEGSPAELDPLGSNVGLHTPYIELTLQPPVEPKYLISQKDCFDQLEIPIHPFLLGFTTYRKAENFTVMTN